MDDTLRKLLAVAADRAEEVGDPLLELLQNLAGADTLTVDGLLATAKMLDYHNPRPLRDRARELCDHGGREEAFPGREFGSRCYCKCGVELVPLAEIVRRPGYRA